MNTLFFRVFTAKYCHPNISPAWRLESITCTLCVWAVIHKNIHLKYAKTVVMHQNEHSVKRTDSRMPCFCARSQLKREALRESRRRRWCWSSFRSKSTQKYTQRHSNTYFQKVSPPSLFLSEMGGAPTWEIQELPAPSPSTPPTRNCAVARKHLLCFEREELDRQSA